MFPTRMFPARMFTPRMWPPGGDAIIAPPAVSPGPGGDPGLDIRRDRYLREEARRQAILRDDQQMIELIAMLAASGVFDEL